MIKKRIFESGRSMVEMLGTLAVVGVLSIGGIMGYNYAMNTQRANATIAELTHYALIASQQALQKQANLNIAELGNITRQGYPISAAVQADPMFFEIYLKDVPTPVCERILDSGWSMPLVMFANNYAYTGETGICDNGDGTLADMAFQFKEDLNQNAMPMGGCIQDSDCKGGCMKCESQQCVSTCVGSERCATDQETGAQVCCPNEKRAGPMCCSSTQNGWCCNASGQCFPWHKPLVDKNGTAYACDHESGVDVTGVTENCSVCSNRELSGNKCILKCPEERPLRATDGKCYSCSETKSVNIGWNAQCTEVCGNRIKAGYDNTRCIIPCQQNEFVDYSGNCYSCDEETTKSTHGVKHTGCDTCINRTAYNTLDGNGHVIQVQCVLDCPVGQIRGADGICYDCTYSSPVKMTDYNSGGYCETVCPNRVITGLNDGVCSLPCLENQFFGADGKCYDCDEVKSIGILGTDKTLCEKCGRIVDNDMCVLYCPSGQFKASSGICYDCNYQDPVWVHFDKTCSTACPNRILNGAGNLYCSLPCGERQVTSENGKCYDCDFDKNINMGGDGRPTYDCSNCSDTRNQYNNMCVPKCPAETPLRGSDNKCYACNDPTRVQVTSMTDVCYECPNERKLDGNYCILK